MTEIGVSDTINIGVQETDSQSTLAANPNEALKVPPPPPFFNDSLSPRLQNHFRNPAFFPPVPLEVRAGDYGYPRQGKPIGTPTAQSQYEIPFLPQQDDYTCAPTLLLSALNAMKIKLVLPARDHKTDPDKMNYLCAISSASQKNSASGEKTRGQKGDLEHAKTDYLIKILGTTEENGTPNDNIPEALSKHFPNLSTKAFSSHTNNPATIEDIKRCLSEGQVVMLNIREPGWNAGHFVLVKQTYQNGIVVNDPWSGSNCFLTNEELNARWQSEFEDPPKVNWMITLKPTRF